jgi:hypothetical protein
LPFFKLFMLHLLCQLLGYLGVNLLPGRQNMVLHYHKKYLLQNWHTNAIRYLLISSSLPNKKFWEELFTNFPLIWHGLYRKWCLQQFFIAAGTRLPSHCLATIAGYRDKHTDSPLIWHGPRRKRWVQQFFYCCGYSMLWECVYQAVA